ncbi:Uncharacterized protein HZ326_28035 [Fusarium oxysporum f. sp. albedinis]|nr:Uncharacterized protein HZ326_28035 [Fusarium oxysporum f. sp. albedinis]
MRTTTKKDYTKQQNQIPLSCNLISSGNHSPIEIKDTSTDRELNDHFNDTKHGQKVVHITPPTRLDLLPWNACHIRHSRQHYVLNPEM